MTHPLVQIAEAVRAEAAHSRVAVIFDLDSTLFSVSPRTQAILRQLGGDEDFTRRHGDEVAQVLRDIDILPTDWGIRQALERSSLYPRLKDNLALFKDVREYWRRHFFANHFLVHDTIYPSANEYVRHLHALGADILYLTGRPESSMREGTRTALQHWGFPLFADSKLYMKPSEVQTDEGFKAQKLRELAKAYDHIWLFENEPVIIEQVRALVPQVRVVFVNSTHSGRAAAPADLPSIQMSYVEGLPRGTKG